jgi:SAM-dependent methyltransferase
MEISFTEETWRAYYGYMVGQPPRETVVFALDKFAAEGLPESGRSAVDMGCGEGRDTVEILRRGWRVFAFDGTAEGIDRLQVRPGLTPEMRERLTTAVMRFEAADIPPVHLINAAYSLPFCPREAFPGLWEKILVSLESGGRFSGQLFGNHDTWAVADRVTFQTRAEVEALLAPLTIEHFVEEERDGTTANGSAKHWHVFHIVARKP